MKSRDALKTYDEFPGLKYNGKRKCAVLDGREAGTKNRRQKTLKDVTFDQALAAWRVFREELASVARTRAPRTLKDFVAAYYDKIAERHAPSTRKTHQAIIRNHLERYFGDDELTSITSVRAEDFIAHMRKRYKPSFVNDCVRVLKLLLRQAVERDVISDYPLKRRVTKLAEKPLRQELRPDERVRFFAAFDDEAAFRAHIDQKRKLGPVVLSQGFRSERRHGGGLRGDSEAAGAYFARFHDLRDFFIVAVETGLRTWSDLLNLQWSSIDFSGGFIRVLMQKTQRVAEIPMSTRCREALRARQARAVVSTFVFVDAHGKQLSKVTIRRAFVLAKTLSGIDHAFRPHDLRHTFGCRLAERNVSLPKIARALGHTTTRMAERYARPSEESMREIKGALDADEFFGERRGAST
jgi:integrase